MTEAREKEYPIAKIGWNEENILLEVVLLNKKERDFLDLKGSSYKIVKVKKVINSVVAMTSLALVQAQFKEFIDKEVVTLNTFLAKKLEVKEGDKVIISKDVFESEVEDFKIQQQQRIREMFMRSLNE